MQVSGQQQEPSLDLVQTTRCKGPCKELVEIPDAEFVGGKAYCAACVEEVKKERR